MSDGAGALLLLQSCPLFVSLGSQARSVCCWWFLLNSTRIEPLQFPALKCQRAQEGSAAAGDPCHRHAGFPQGQSPWHRHGAEPRHKFQCLKVPDPGLAQAGGIPLARFGAPVNTGVPVPQCPWAAASEGEWRCRRHFCHRLVFPHHLVGAGITARL